MSRTDEISLDCNATQPETWEKLRVQILHSKRAGLKERVAEIAVVQSIC